MTASSGATTERKRARQGQVPHAVDKTVRTAGGHAEAVLTEQASDDRGVARARVDQRIPHPEAAAHVGLGIGEPIKLSASSLASEAWLSQMGHQLPVSLPTHRPPSPLKRLNFKSSQRWHD